MLRHLKNLTELTLYASISCGLAFVSRMFPAFHYPLLLLRLGVLGYCAYVIGATENNKELAVIISSALLLGLIGGYWDWIEIYIRFDNQRVMTILSIILLVLLAIPAIVLQVRYGKPNEK
jgi:hypothetical protein